MIAAVPLKINKAIYHLGFWSLAYFFWVYIFRNNALVITHTITIQFCYLVFIAANYYFNSLYAMPKLLNRKKYVQFASAFLAMIIATAWLRVPVSYLVRKYLFGLYDIHYNVLNIFYESFINIFFWVFFFVAAKMMIERVRSQVYIEQIEKEKAANELNFLRAQFNPHFLFNSINSIYAHIDKSNKEARNMLLTFSDMLRYQLYECDVERIGMEQELNYIKNYIALQKSRIDERIQVSFTANNLNNNVKVPPLILITFIENAFKYVGFNEGKENRIEISLGYESGNLKFRIFNTKDNFITKELHSSGLGIANTKRRLELLYPGKYSLNIQDTDNAYTVSLTIFDI
ncbi:MAG: histidine kinase [Bacteroidetes bacterium]|nr:histidine kinase [Bacteroidota bacterium]